MTMSRKSMLSSSICSRKGTSFCKVDKSSSGTIRPRISSRTCLISSAFIQTTPTANSISTPSICKQSFRTAFDNQDRIDPQHAERVVQDVVDLPQIAGLVGHDTRCAAVTVGVGIIEVDCSVSQSIVKGRDVTEQF